MVSAAASGALSWTPVGAGERAEPAHGSRNVFGCQTVEITDDTGPRGRGRPPAPLNHASTARAVKHERGTQQSLSLDLFHRILHRARGRYPACPADDRCRFTDFERLRKGSSSAPDPRRAVARGTRASRGSEHAICIVARRPEASTQPRDAGRACPLSRRVPHRFHRGDRGTGAGAIGVGYRTALPHRRAEARQQRAWRRSASHIADIAPEHERIAVFTDGPSPAATALAPIAAIWAIFRMTGWGGRIRTYGTRYQKPLPYHLATPQRAGVCIAGFGGVQGGSGKTCRGIKPGTHAPDMPRGNTGTAPPGFRVAGHLPVTCSRRRNPVAPAIPGARGAARAIRARMPPARGSPYLTRISPRRHA